MNNKLFFIALIALILFLGCIPNNEKNTIENVQISQKAQTEEKAQPKVTKVHWFLPDGMRAEPNLFNIYKWAEEGKLPNIKKLMEKGSYGFSIPTFPTHTPTNFATLVTGTYPKVHGVADGPMHIEGFPLLKPSVAGFRSSARKVPAIWSIFEKQGKEVTLLSMPGSTPPELKQNSITIRGRWGGWGADFHSLIFETKTKQQRKKLGKGARLFFLGYELTKFIEPAGGTNWKIDQSFSKPINIKFNIHGAEMFGSIVDTSDDEKINYNKIIFSKNKKDKEAELEKGQWSDWIPTTFKWNEKEVPSHIKINVIKLEDDGFFRIRFVVNNLNKFIVEPSKVSEELVDEIGPMVDFVDNFPPQLIFYEEDKKAFLDEAKMSFNWHRDAVDAIYKLYDPDVFIHNIYTPNQMLTSRWWLGYIDPSSTRYNEVSKKERDQLWNEVMDMYKELDNIVGTALNNLEEDDLFILSSDHGATPLNKWVRINNLFANKGWLQFEINPETGEPIIDWKKTKVIYLKMDNVYISPEGLENNWTRSSGIEYEKLRSEVRKTLEDLTEKGNKVVTAVVNWEEVEEFLDLPTDRVGDLVIANQAGYGWNEEVTADRRIFDIPLKTGYKQAIFAKETPAMWTPFIIAGPGVKQNHFIEEPIEMVDQMPTILRVLGQPIPYNVQGRVIGEVLS
jgi:predicted AlkP superfamily phosphohydrolase/phosphomutase